MKNMVQYPTILVHFVHHQVFGKYAIALLMLAAQSQDSVWLGVELMRNVRIVVKSGVGLRHGLSGVQLLWLLVALFGPGSAH